MTYRERDLSVEDGLASDAQVRTTCSDTKINDATRESAEAGTVAPTAAKRSPEAPFSRHVIRSFGSRSSECVRRPWSARKLPGIPCDGDDVKWAPCRSQSTRGDVTRGAYAKHHKAASGPGGEQTAGNGVRRTFIAAVVAARVVARNMVKGSTRRSSGPAGGDSSDATRLYHSLQKGSITRLCATGSPHQVPPALNHKWKMR